MEHPKSTIKLSKAAENKFESFMSNISQMQASSDLIKLIKNYEKHTSSFIFQFLLIKDKLREEVKKSCQTAFKVLSIKVDLSGKSIKETSSKTTPMKLQTLLGLPNVDKIETPDKNTLLVYTKEVPTDVLITNCLSLFNFNYTIPAYILEYKVHELPIFNTTLAKRANIDLEQIECTHKKLSFHLLPATTYERDLMISPKLLTSNKYISDSHNISVYSQNPYQSKSKLVNDKPVYGQLCFGVDGSIQHKALDSLDIFSHISNTLKMLYADDSIGNGYSLWLNCKLAKIELDITNRLHKLFGDIDIAPSIHHHFCYNDFDEEIYIEAVESKLDIYFDSILNRIYLQTTNGADKFKTKLKPAIKLKLTKDFLSELQKAFDDDSVKTSHIQCELSNIVFEKFESLENSMSPVDYNFNDLYQAFTKPKYIRGVAYNKEHTKMVDFKITPSHSKVITRIVTPNETYTYTQFYSLILEQCK